MVAERSAGIKTSERRIAPERLAARALTDRDLVLAMRAHDPWAWAEFESRFRPVLERSAARLGIPRIEWPVCVDEVLEDEMLRFSIPNTKVMENLAGYLVRAVRHRYSRLQRDAATRERHYAGMTDEGDDELVVRALCSSAARRAAAPPEPDDGTERARVQALVGRLAHLLLTEVSVEERLLLTWEAECVPHRQIAEWIGANYEAATKRIRRLCRRLQARGLAIVATWPLHEQEAIAPALGDMGNGNSDADGARRNAGGHGR